MDAYSGLNSSNAFTPVLLDDYKEHVSYDPNGNILTYTRNGNKAGVQKPMDNLSYNYKSNTNQLVRVKDAIAATNYTEDIDDQPANNYDYDAIGNLIQDTKEGITKITWTVYGKIESITKTDGTAIDYSYDAAGNRISKTVNEKETWYVRDAQGNIMSVYNKDASLNNGHFTQSELHLYGSSRLGIYNIDKDLTLTPPAATNLGSGNSGGFGIFERNKKFFELSNHLGNVLATVSDEKIGVDLNNDGVIDYYTPSVVSANDYYPFGMTMPGRSFVTPTPGGVYRYGFNGKENDKDITDGAQDYGMRINDSRLGRFLSVDPLTSSYPWYTPYQFAGNKPIWAVDLDGLEEMPSNDGTEEGQRKPTSKEIFNSRGDWTGTKTKEWFWHKGSKEYGTKADWYDEKDYGKTIRPVASDLAGFAEMYGSTGIQKNWNEEEKANIANTKLGKFLSSGLSEDAAQNLIAEAYNVANQQRLNSSGTAYLSSINAEDILFAGTLIKFGVKSLASTAAKEGRKAIVIGEGMNAVRTAAKTLRSQGIDAKWYQAWSKNFPTDRLMTPKEYTAALARNERWINSKIDKGYDIYNIGIDITRATRSPFYKVEQNVLQQRRYPTIKIPR